MKYLYSIIILLFSFTSLLPAQEIRMKEMGTLEQVYQEAVESEEPLSFNDLNIEFGYVLYQTEIEIESEESILELENVRDYGVVYLNDNFQGSITDNNKRLMLNASPGEYTLSLYVENIGRITYGPEILDNSKGLFGSVVLDGIAIENWTILPLSIKECNVKGLQFTKENATQSPSFYKGSFEIETPKETYLDISGWGMGEVWLNGNYIGSYWEAEKQQSIQVSVEDLLEGKNELVVFDLKRNIQQTMKLSDKPVFK